MHKYFNYENEKNKHLRKYYFFLFKKPCVKY